MASERLRILVLGYIVRGPIGGLAWHHLQYVLGLHRMGHDVWFFEDSEDYEACYDPDAGTMTADPSYGLRFAQDAFSRLGLADRWTYWDAHTETWLGSAADSAAELVASADVLLNVSAVNPLRPWLRDVPVRALIDTDPVFVQIRHLSSEHHRSLAEQHNRFFTFGENFGTEGCSIPDDGLPWKPTRQPVVTDCWPVTPGSADACFTTVMQWDSYKEEEYDGRRFGMKSRSFNPYLNLPERLPGERLELAIGSPTAPRESLRKSGWGVIDPLVPTKTPWSYRDYLAGSKGELSVAKHGYVVTHSGWFSERSANYLASGRPVIVQDTGFGTVLPTGAGLLAFNSPEEAVAAVEQVSAEYRSHCEAARRVAEQHFEAGVVLERFIEML